MSKHNVAKAMEKRKLSGDYPQIELMHREVLEHRRRVLGEEHPETVMSMSNIAKVLSSQGKFAVAEAKHRETLVIRERVFGWDHVSILKIPSLSSSPVQHV